MLKQFTTGFNKIVKLLFIACYVKKIPIKKQKFFLKSLIYVRKKFLLKTIMTNILNDIMSSNMFLYLHNTYTTFKYLFANHLMLVSTLQGVSVVIVVLVKALFSTERC